jgi:hypothetical protein
MFTVETILNHRHHRGRFLGTVSNQPVQFLICGLFECFRNLEAEQDRETVCDSRVSGRAGGYDSAAGYGQVLPALFRRTPGPHQDGYHSCAEGTLRGPHAQMLSFFGNVCGETRGIRN